MYQYSNSLIRQFPSLVTGNAAVGVHATVYIGETGATASLFESNGTTPKANPVTTDGKGFYSFSVADGDYRIVFSSGQFATLRISVLDGAAIREEFDDLVASNLAFRNEQQAAYDSFVLSQGWDQVGTFAVGFTYTSPNQVGQDVDGNWWRSIVIPKPVAPATDPTSDPDYKLVGDGVLRSDLASPSSNVLIASVEAAEMVRKYKEYPSIKDEGAVGNGSTSDQAAFDAAISTAQDSILLPDKGRYLVTSTANQLGKEFTGNGHLVKAATGGLEAQNTYADHYQRVTGQEYLAAWYRNVWFQTITPNRELRIVFSGDSTTEGGIGNGVNNGFNIWELVPQGLYNRGLQGSFGTIGVNRGQSGANTQQWVDSFVAGDIAAAGDLYIVRWGINDPGWLKDGTSPPIDSGQSYPNRRDINDFATSLRAGLAAMRASLPFESVSILLMMPNSTYDIPNGRDALWYEQLRDVYVQAARDFNCAFIDTYAIMQDSRKLFNILMDDPMPTSGRGIHPNDAMNSIIAGYICDLIVPEGFKYRFAKNRFISVCGTDSSPNIATAPDYYAAEICHHRTLTAEGWPIDGAATTLTTADNIMLQLHYGYLNADRGKIKARFGRKVALGEAAGFSGLWDLILSPPAADKGAIVAASGFTQSASRPVEISIQGDCILLEGAVTKNTPAALALNDALVNYSGTYSIGGVSGAAHGTATVFSGTVFEQIPVYVGVDGIVRAATASTISCNQISISISYIRR